MIDQAELEKLISIYQENIYQQDLNFSTGHRTIFRQKLEVFLTKTASEQIQLFTIKLQKMFYKLLTS